MEKLKALLAINVHVWTFSSERMRILLFGCGLRRNTFCASAGKKRLTAWITIYFVVQIYAVSAVGLFMLLLIRRKLDQAYEHSFSTLDFPWFQNFIVLFDVCKGNVHKLRRVNGIKVAMKFHGVGHKLPFKFKQWKLLFSLVESKKVSTQVSELITRPPFTRLWLRSQTTFQ